MEIPSSEWFSTQQNCLERGARYSGWKGNSITSSLDHPLYDLAFGKDSPLFLKGLFPEDPGFEDTEKTK